MARKKRNQSNENTQSNDGRSPTNFPTFSSIEASFRMPVSDKGILARVLDEFINCEIYSSRTNGTSPEQSFISYDPSMFRRTLNAHVFSENGQLNYKPLMDVFEGQTSLEVFIYKRSGLVVDPTPLYLLSI
ncbi:MAG: hypothetical protein AABX51_02675 [Nanoarchaeota archaeon]